MMDPNNSQYRRNDINRYERKEKLGEGTYGTVYRAVDRVTGEVVAFKKIKLHDEDEGIPSTTLREVSLLKILEHPNIVKLKDVLLFDQGKKLYLIFEFADMDLHQYMRSVAKLNPQNPRLELDLIQSYIKQLLEGMRYCHLRRIIHRDLKPQNLLVTKDGKLKLADFGLARAYAVPIPTYTHEIVTLWYRAPEILLGAKQYALGVDIWSIGCIFAELATFSPLFPGDCEIDQIFNIFKVLGTPDESVWPGVSSLPDYKPAFPKWRPKGLLVSAPKLKYLGEDGNDLLSKMLVFDPAKRISAKKGIGTSLFQKIFYKVRDEK